jgi:hypothetical protein
MSEVMASDSIGARFEHGSSWLRRALVAWPLLAVFGVVNGIARELLYRKPLGEGLSHQISGVTLSVAMAAYVVVLERRWKLTAADARRIGATGLLLTLAFEFGFGRFLDHKTWSELFHDYNLLRGRTWPLVLAFLAALPLLARELRRRTGV